MARVLLVDDEDVFREDLAQLLRDEGHSCTTAASGEEALRLAPEICPEVVLCDLMMPGISGTEVIRRLASECPEVCVILLTAHAGVESAVEAFRAGAADYLIKPVAPAEVLLKIERCAVQRRLQLELRYLRREVCEGATGTTLIGDSPAIHRLRQLIARVGPARSTVLVTGETGTGKELVARALHEAGGGTKAPFIAVNCAALPRDLLESELFGYTRGAFTGAHRDKPGLFELADGGTLFLDEIGELQLDLQPKLLRILDHQEVFRVGATAPVRVEVRLIAATNRRLEDEVAAGRFREDLFYRLSVVCISLPPLRERREDVPPLVDHLLRRLNQRLKRRVLGVDAVALRTLMSAGWRGNVRELQNVLERAVLLSDNEMLSLADLPAELTGAATPPEPGEDLKCAVRAYERQHIRQVLAAVGGNREEAARRLGVDPSTVYRRLKELEPEAG